MKALLPALILPGLCIFSALVPAQVPAQSNKRETPQLGPPRCTLKLDESPTLRGFRLRMTVEEAQKVSPQLRIGEIAGKQYAYMPRRTLEGIEKFELEFQDGRVVSIRVQYGKTVEWDGIGQFVETVSPALKLPGVGWQTAGRELAMLSCADFSVRAYILDSQGPALVLTNTAAVQSEKDRLEAERKKKREAFKP